MIVKNQNPHFNKNISFQGVKFYGNLSKLDGQCKAELDKTKVHLEKLFRVNDIFVSYVDDPYEAFPNTIKMVVVMKKTLKRFLGFKIKQLKVKECDFLEEHEINMQEIIKKASSLKEACRERLKQEIAFKRRI